MTVREVRRWRQHSQRIGSAYGFTGLAETVARFEQSGFEITGIIGSSVDDWDHYRSLQWLAIEEWLAKNPDDPHAGEVLTEHARRKHSYFRFERALLGDAMFVGRKA